MATEDRLRELAEKGSTTLTAAELRLIADELQDLRRRETGMADLHPALKKLAESLVGRTRPHLVNEFTEAGIDIVAILEARHDPRQ